MMATSTLIAEMMVVEDPVRGDGQSLGKVESNDAKATVYVRRDHVLVTVDIEAGNEVRVSAYGADVFTAYSTTERAEE